MELGCVGGEGGEIWGAGPGANVPIGALDAESDVAS